MTTFKKLIPTLAAFEKAQFASLCSVFKPNPTLAGIIHGGAQFVSAQCIGCRDTDEVPVIACVGVNYYQSRVGPGYPALHQYLLSLYPRSTGVEDNGTSMVSPLNFTLSAYRRNFRQWIKDGRASSRISISPKGPCILVATNLSPFITLRSWLQHRAAAQNAALAAWPFSTHLNALYHTIGADVDLWIGHHKTCVWHDFTTWKTSAGLRSWLLTHNLSGLGLRSMLNAQKKISNPDHVYFS